MKYYKIVKILHNILQRTVVAGVARLAVLAIELTELIQLIQIIENFGISDVSYYIFK